MTIETLVGKWCVNISIVELIHSKCINLTIDDNKMMIRNCTFKPIVIMKEERCKWETIIVIKEFRPIRNGIILTDRLKRWKDMQKKTI